MVRDAYAASKAELEAHTVNLAAELRGTGVTVNAYRPGGVDTAMQVWSAVCNCGTSFTPLSWR
jgi:NAD(P)-dependent dehydrogenase (short-subunit alcohol dehydrogenase family)